MRSDRHLGCRRAQAASQPTIYSRADWGADESLRGGTVEFGQIQAGFVHHTVNSNDYRQEDVPAIIRGIYAYHVQSRGWRDIGYNFLIDKWGRIWEGRYGGVDKPVTGAHTLGHNDDVFGASAIGTYVNTEPTSATLDAYARLFAWKFSLHEVDPLVQANLDGEVVNTISGHRDTYATACPGDRLYARLPELRTNTSSLMATPEPPPAATATKAVPEGDFDFNRDGNPDIIARSTTGNLYLYPGNGGTGFGARATIGYGGWNGMTALIGPGDFNRDGNPDIIARSTTGNLYLYPGNGGTGFGARATIGYGGWNGMTALIGPGDFNRDGNPDIIARSTTGNLYLYPGNGGTGFGARATIGYGGWNGMTALIGPGDFNRDGNPDIIARSTTGNLYLYPGNGGTGFGARATIGYGGWNGMTALAPDHTDPPPQDATTQEATTQDSSQLPDRDFDFNRDGNPDIIARSTTGNLYLYPGNGGTGFGARATIGYGGWNGMTALIGPGDFNRDGNPDIIARSTTGNLYLYPGNGGTGFGARVTIGYGGWNGMTALIGPGDFNRDGNPDIIARSTTGNLYLYPGNGGTGFGARATIGYGGWNGMTALIGPGDFNRDGNPDIIARSTTGNLYLYPGNGGTGFGARATIGYGGWNGMTALIGPGDFNRDGNPDIIARSTTGNLYLYPGNGGTGFGARATIGYGGWNGMTALIGPGDFNRDGNPDIIARSTTGNLYLYPGNGGTGFGARATIGYGGWNGMTALAPDHTDNNQLLLESVARPADGAFTLSGRGYGHGRGLSQWGSYKAASMGETWRSIVSFYYPGAALKNASSGTIRVRLEGDTGNDLIVRPEAGLTIEWTRESGERAVAIAPTQIGSCSPRWWRVRAVGSDQAIDYLCNDWQTWQGTSAIRGTAPVAFLTSDGVIDTAVRAGSGFVRKAYRGKLEGINFAGSIAVTNVVALESYLRSVVPNEIPASWPNEALNAQAVAARTYAMRERYDRARQPFDVYDSTRSQVYRGVHLYDDSWNVVRTHEDSRTDAAVAATAGQFLEVSGVPAFTQFSSSNGGVTAAGSVPYLRHQLDAWDRAATANPNREWKDSISVSALESRYPAIGTLRQVRVLERSGEGAWGGRVLRVRLDGSAGGVTLSSDTSIRRTFGTLSSYFTIS